MATFTPQRTLARLGIILLLVAALLYGLFEARKLIEGPRLSLTVPRDGGAVAGPLVRIQGKAENIAFLSVDGKRSYADAEGRFSETLSLPPGLAVIAVEATDRFGRQTALTRHVQVVSFCPLTPDAIS